MRGQRVLLTGASGFIGQHLLRYLNQQGNWSITALQGRADCDLSQLSQVMALPPCELIIHLAGSTTVQHYDAQPHQMFEVNLNTTLNLLEYARISGVKRFILASTYVYGLPQYLPVDEKHPVAPNNGYTLSKYLAEEIARRYVLDFGGQLCIARLFNVYGPGQPSLMLIPSILQQLQAEKLCLRDPFPERDFIHIDDILRAFESLMTYQMTVPIEIINFGSGQSISVRDLVAMILRLSGQQKQIQWLNQKHSQEVNQVLADIRKAYEILGWQPEVSLEMGLSRLLACGF